jgi:hypothetical protein
MEGTCVYLCICYLNLISVSMSFDLVYFLERKSYKGFARGMRGINIC